MTRKSAPGFVTVSGLSLRSTDGYVQTASIPCCRQNNAAGESKVSCACSRLRFCKLKNTFENEFLGRVQDKPFFKPQYDLGINGKEAASSPSVTEPSECAGRRMGLMVISFWPPDRAKVKKKPYNPAYFSTRVPYRRSAFCAMPMTPYRMALSLRPSSFTAAINTAPVKPEELLGDRDLIEEALAATTQSPVEQPYPVPVPDAITLALELLDDSNQEVRAAVATLMGYLPDPRCVSRLIDTMSNKTQHYSIRANAAGALGFLEDPSAMDALIAAVYDDPEWVVRYSAVVSLGHLRYSELPDPKQARRRVFDICVQALDLGDPLLRQAAIGSLGAIGEPDALELLVPRFLKDPDWLLRLRLVEALSLLPPTPATFLALEVMTDDENISVSELADSALRDLRARLGSRGGGWMDARENM